MEFRGQRPPADQDFEKWYLFFYFNDFCEFLDFPSMGFRRQRPPAGQDFEKRHLFFDVDVYGFLDSPSMGFQGQGR